MISPIKLWRNQKQTRELLGKEGTVVSYTLVRVPPAGFAELAPYWVALVSFGSFQYLGQLIDVDNQDVCAGMKVKAVVRRIRVPDPEGVIPYGIKFKPV